MLILILILILILVITIKDYVFNTPWIRSFQNRHHLIKENTQVKTEIKSSSSSSSLSNRDNVIPKIAYNTINDDFESAILMKLKNIPPISRPNSMYSYEHNQIKAICNELKDEYNVSLKFSNTWLSSFQLRHQLVQSTYSRSNRKCRFFHEYLCHLNKKIESVDGRNLKVSSTDAQEAVCPHNNDKNIGNTTTKPYSRSNRKCRFCHKYLCHLNKKVESVDGRNLKVSSIDAHEAVCPHNNDKNIGNTTTKPSPIENWNSLNNETKRKIPSLIKSGRHIKKRNLLWTKDEINIVNNNDYDDNNNTKQMKYELNINDYDDNRKNDYIPKSDDECEVESLLLHRSKMNRNNFKNDLEQQQKIVKKLLNGMTLIPDNDQFILYNFKKENVIEANKNIEMIKSKLDHFINM